MRGPLIIVTALLLGLAPLRSWAAEGASSALDQALAAYEAGDVKAAARGFKTLSSRKQLPLADYNLAMLHIRGELPRNDLSQAQRLLKRAAANGLLRAELALGTFYEQGLQSATGRPDLLQAHHWYGLAAKHGSSEAQVALGTAYYLGRGVATDMAQAAHWFRAAANQGDEGAQYLLASMYEAGLGLTQDLRLARYWYEAAAHNGDVAAPYKVKEIDQRLQAPDLTAPL
ncbi:tetratricopeptide repeat protein [Paucibacter sp. KCTC 42545]|uniref:tetratricopeptide repeat protein n=1 Tax=Paucibacter sp. KCTC 42545 TaxID=1768242 RepID=UPI000733C190|nr:tetratricopeptide repeat protein [Paucibacter sp. KCTC 42545]ALT79492.1 hypothetical protein AT984_22110 [Paucibacter sp. KCTC 42545]